MWMHSIFVTLQKKITNLVHLDVTPYNFALYNASSTRQSKLTHPLVADPGILAGGWLEKMWISLLLFSD